MRTAHLVVAACVLMTMPSALLAQRRGQRAADASSKDAAKMMARPAGRRGMAGQRAAIGRTLRSVLTASNRVAQRSRSGNASYEWIKAQALQIQANLHFGLKQLDQAEAIATPAEKRHLAQIRSHEEEALATANQLVTEAQKPKPDRSAIYTRVHAIYQEIQAAGPVTASDDWTQ